MFFFISCGNPLNYLMNCYYVLISPDYLCMITQRQANQMIQKGKSIGRKNKNGQTEIIARLSDLTIESKIIKKFQLQKALTHAKFYNGSENFKILKERRILLKLFQNIKREQLRKYVEYFLEKRNMLQEKYKGSSLAQIYQEMLIQLDPRKQFDDDLVDESQSDQNKEDSDSEMEDDFANVQLKQPESFEKLNEFYMLSKK